MEVSIIIPSRNNLKWLLRCIPTLLSQDFEEYEVIVVDNGSTDGSLSEIKILFPNVKLIEMGYDAFLCASVNAGISYATGDYIALVNNDTEFPVSWLSNAIQTFKHDCSVGAVASKILSLRNPKLIDSAGNYLLKNGLAGNRGWQQPDDGKYDKEIEVFSPSSAGAVYRKSVLKEIGGFDDHLVAYYEDIDAAFRIRLLGYRCVYNPKAVMYHYGSGTKESSFKRLRLVERNMVINLIKNMPTELLKKYGGSILKANLLLNANTEIDRQRQLFPWFFGKIGSLKLLSYAIQQRKLIQMTRKINLEELENIISTKYFGHVHL
jgi:hypothetical protein